MDVLTAHTPAGFLHAVTCDWPEGLNHGERFRQTQECQGCTVRRYAMAEYLALRSAVHATPSVGTRPLPEPGPAVNSGAAGRVADPRPEPRPPSEEPAPAGDDLEIGAAIVHPVIGYAVITHVIVQGGVRVPVARGPRGEGLVRDEWRRATDADLPGWMRPQEVAVEVTRPADPAQPSAVPFSPYAWVQGPVWSVQAPVYSVLSPIWSAAPVAVQSPTPVVSTLAPKRAAGRERMPSLWGEL